MNFILNQNSFKNYRVLPPLPRKQKQRKILPNKVIKSYPIIFDRYNVEENSSNYLKCRIFPLKPSILPATECMLEAVRSYETRSRSDTRARPRRWLHLCVKTRVYVRIRGRGALVFGLWSRLGLVYKYNESCAPHNITSLLARDLD